MAEFKNYEVRYDLNVNPVGLDNAFRAVENLARTMNEPLEQIKKAVNGIAGAIRTLKNSTNNNNQFVFEAKTNTEAFQKQLLSLVSMARQYGEEASKAWSEAMSKGVSIIGKAKPQKPGGLVNSATMRHLRKESKQLDQWIEKQQYPKKKGTVSKEELGKIQKTLQDRVAHSTLLSKKALDLTDLNEAKKWYENVIASKQKVRTSYASELKKWRAQQQENAIRIPATVSLQSGALASLNSTWERLQMMVRPIVIPVTVASNINAGKGVRGTVEGLQKVAGNVSAQQKAPILKLDTRVVPTGQAGFDLNAHIAKLQELANSRPIKLTTTISQSASGIKGAKGNAVNTVQMEGIIDNVVLSKSVKVSGGPVKVEGIVENVKAGRGMKPIEVKANVVAPGIKSKVNALKELSTVWASLPKTGSRTYTVNLKMPGIENLGKLKELIGMVGTMPPSQRRSYNVGANTGTRSASNAVVSNVANKGTATTRYIGRPKGTMNTLAYQLMGNTSLGARTPVFLDMMKGMGMMSGVGAAMSTLTSSFTNAAEYQNTMVTARAILENNYQGSNFNTDFANMERIVRDVAKKTKFTAPQAADAARFMAMAGLNIPMINASIKPIADVAVIGDNDLGEVADKITNIQTAFGIQPNKMRALADALTKTFTSSNTDMMMLAESMEYAAPMAHLAGAQVEDALAMIGIMGNAGIQGSMAGTTLRMMYQNIINPNKKQQKMWESLGIKLKDEKGNPRQLIDILGDLRQKVRVSKEDKDEEGKFKDEGTPIAEAVSKLFRVTASAGAGTLLENLDKVIALAEANRNAAGLSQRISEVKQNDIKGMWAKMTSAFTDAVVTEFESKESPIKGYIESLTKYFNSPDFKDLLKDIFELVTSMLNMLGKFAKIWREIYNIFGPIIKYTLMAQFILAQIGYMLAPLRSVWLTISRGVGAANGLMAGGAAMSGVGTAGISNTGVAMTAAAGSFVPISRATYGKGYRNYTRIGGTSLLASSALGQAYLSRTAGVGMMPTAYNAMAQGGRSAMRLGANADVASAVLLGGAVRGRYVDEYARRAKQYQRLHDNTMAGNRVRTQAAQNARIYSNAAGRANEIKARAKRIYGFRRTTGRAFMSGFNKATTLGMAGVSITSILGGLKGVVMAVSKALGFMLNPITLAVGALGVLAYSFWSAKKRFDEQNENWQRAIRESGDIFRNDFQKAFMGDMTASQILENVKTVNISNASVNIEEKDTATTPLAQDEKFKEWSGLFTGRVTRGLNGKYSSIGGVSWETLVEAYDQVVAPWKGRLSGIYDKEQFKKISMGGNGTTRNQALAASQIVSAGIAQQAITSNEFLETQERVKGIMSEYLKLSADDRKIARPKMIAVFKGILDKYDPQKNTWAKQVTEQNFQQAANTVTPNQYLPYYEAIYSRLSDMFRDNPAFKMLAATDELSFNKLSKGSPGFRGYLSNIVSNYDFLAGNQSTLFPVRNGAIQFGELASQWGKDKSIENKEYQIVNGLLGIYTQMLASNVHRSLLNNISKHEFVTGLIENSIEKNASFAGLNTSELLKWVDQLAPGGKRMQSLNNNMFSPIFNSNRNWIPSQKAYAPSEQVFDRSSHVTIKTDSIIKFEGLNVKQEMKPEEAEQFVVDSTRQELAHFFEMLMQQ